MYKPDSTKKQNLSYLPSHCPDNNRKLNKTVLVTENTMFRPAVH